MKAVMYGGGNIGRGFISATLSQSGYEVTFIDVAEPVVNALQKNHSYPVRYVSNEGHEDVLIRNVTAVNGNDAEAASEAIADCDIMATAVGARILKFIVHNAMLESALALSRHYGASLAELQMHITDLLGRFSNAALRDTCQRVGGDPARKLGTDDRLIGASRLALAQGVTPAYAAVGAAAGLCRYFAETEGLEQSVACAKQALCSISGLQDGDELADLILDSYQMLLEQCEIAQLLKHADMVKSKSLRNIV